MKTIHCIILVICVACLTACSKDGGGIQSSSVAGTGKAGSLARFAIVDNYLYALDKSDIVCYDISNGANPIVKNRVKVAFDIETIYPYNNMLFIGSSTGMYAYSLANPAEPSLTSMVSHVRACDPVVVQGNYAFVTLRGGTTCGGTNVLNVYDITNLYAPSLKKTIPMPAPYGLGVTGNALYVTNPAGIRLFNIAQPDNPIVVSDIPEPTASDVIPYNNTLIVQLQKGSSFYDISNVFNPVFQSRITQ